MGSRQARCQRAEAARAFERALQAARSARLDGPAIQRSLEQQGDAANEPDPYVYEELAALYHAKGDPEQARRYEERKAAAQKR